MTKIALISDIHFGKFSRTKDFIVPGEELVSITSGEKSLKDKLISKLKEEDTEYILITGDLTSIGSSSEFNYCKIAIQEIAQAAGVKSEKVIICLGNHDIDWCISELPSSQNFNSEDIRNESIKDYLKVSGSVANHWFTQMNNYQSKGPAPFTGIIEFDDIICFSLNSGWLCSKGDSIKQGKLDELQLKWISSTLAKYKENPKWKILLLHHHPFNYPYHIPLSDHSVLKEGPELNELIGKNGINIVCHGHRHHPRVKNEMDNGWLNPVTFISSGSLSVNVDHRNEDIPNLFHIIELSSDKAFYLRTYKFNSLHGWEKLKENNDFTPVDFEMFFQKPVSIDDARIIIKEVCAISKGDSHKELVQWRDLPNELKSINIDKLNDLINEECKNKNIKIFGRYPDDNVVLLKSNK